MRRPLLLIWVLALLALGGSAAQAQSSGFQVGRYEPTAAGEWSMSVEHPWYSATRRLAVGLTLNYGHDPLVFGYRSLDGTFSRAGAVIAHQLIGHLDVAGSFRDRVLLTLSLPVTLLELGTAQYGIAPADGVAVGDPRLGVKVRLLGQPYRSALSLSLGADLWIPLNSLGSPPPFPAQVGESGVRVLPKLMLGGVWRSVLWSLTAGFYLRPDQLIGTLPDGSGNNMGSEVQLGAAVAYARPALRLAIGPEAVLSTIVSGGHAFASAYTSLELLLGAHYNVNRLVQLGLGAGVGVLREPGTPDARLLLRVAYAPWPAETPVRRDRDGDAIDDPVDACPDVPGVAAAEPQQHGCPAPKDGDGDGVIDAKDRCPTEPMGSRPDPSQSGCPLRDQDGDGVLDPDDRCIAEPAGARPDLTQPGCPRRDQDGDGVFDPEDQCASVPAGSIPDPRRPGCPDKDSDEDGIFDGADQCPLGAVGLLPDPERRGCPLADRDGDQVPDRTDACPDQPGAPSAAPKKNGCRGLVEVKAGQLVLLKPVFFARDKDVILKKSFPVLDALAGVLAQLPQLKKLAIEGHPDDRRPTDYPIELPVRRARSVQAYLVAKGIAAERLTAKGHGTMRPLSPKQTRRAQNPSVEFIVLEPRAKAATPATPPTVPQADQPLPRPRVKGQQSPKAPKSRKSRKPRR